jgi:hypothetical protein
MIHSLSNWKPYLSEDDYDYLINFVENAKNNFPNNKMIVLLGNGGRNGKTKLITEIANYLGNENFNECDDNGSAFIEPVVKLVHITSLETYKEKYIQQLNNIIQYGQSLIADTNKIEKIDKSIQDNSRIIEMYHIFS